MAARRARAVCGAAVLVCWAAGWAAAGERTERFDKDPGWEGRNNRAATPPRRTVRGRYIFSNWLWALIVLALIGVVIWGWAFDFSPH